MAEFTNADQQLLDKNLSHGLVFPQAFKDRLRDAILDAIRNTSYKQVPGMGAVRGKKLLQWSGTVGVWTAVTSGWEHMSQSDIGTHGDVKYEGIADGKYMIMWGCQISCGGSPGGKAGLSINGDTPIDAEALHGISTSQTRFRCMVRTLKNSDNNTIEMLARNDVAASLIIDYPQITIIKIADQ